MTSGTIKLLAALGAAIALASCATEVPPAAGMAEPAELPSAVSAAAETPRAAPAAPAGLTASGGDRSISLTWNDPGDAGIVSYEFRVRAPEDSDWRRWRVMVDSSPTTTSHLLPNLTAGVRYRVQVRARNAAGAGPAAEAAATAQPVAAPAATAQPVTAPAPPKGLTASGGDRSISLAWDDPGDASISGYQFRARPSRDPDWPSWGTMAGSTYRTTSYTLLRGLANGALYDVQVRARNAAGAGPASGASATPRPPAPSGVPPAAPAGLAAQAGDASISLAWDDPGDASISGYEFRVRVAADADWRNWRPVAASTYLTTSHALRGLTNGALYRVQVRARNAAGAGEASETAATPGVRDARGK